MSAFCRQPTPPIDDHFDAPTPPLDLEDLPDATPSRGSTASLDDPMACDQGAAITGGSSVYGPPMASNQVDSWWQEAHGFHGLPTIPPFIPHHDPCWSFLYATLEALASSSRNITLEAHPRGAADPSNCFTKEQVNWIVEYRFRNHQAYYRCRHDMWQSAAKEFNRRFGAERSANALQARFRRAAKGARRAVENRRK